MVSTTSPKSTAKGVAPVSRVITEFSRAIKVKIDRLDRGHKIISINDSEWFERMLGALFAFFPTSDGKGTATVFTACKLP